MTIQRLIRLAGISGLSAVALGAFGAHVLEAQLSARLMDVYQTGVQYQFYHTLALLMAALLCYQYPGRGRIFAAAGWAFVAGIMLFSGSLYLLALTGISWLGAITPLGGLAFLLGWALVLRASFQRNGL